MELDQLKYKNWPERELQDKQVSEQFLIRYTQQKSEQLFDRILDHIRTERMILLAGMVFFVIAGISYVVEGDRFWIIYCLGFLALVFFNLHLIRKMRSRVEHSFSQEQTVIGKLQEMREVVKSYLRLANFFGWFLSIILIVYIMIGKKEYWLSILQDETVGPPVFRYASLVVLAGIYFLVMYIAYYIYNGWYRRTLRRLESTIAKFESERESD